MPLPIIGRDLADVAPCLGPSVPSVMEQAHRWRRFRRLPDLAPHCGQCDGSHHHEWRLCRYPDERVHIGFPIRCVVCGAWKCGTFEDCLERLGHRGPHLGLDRSHPERALRILGTVGGI